MTDTGQLRSKKGLSIDVAADLGDLLMDLTHNKETRADIGRLIKKAKPDSPHAEAFKDVELEDRLSQYERQQEDKQIEEARKRIISRMGEQRRRLLDGSGDGGRKFSEDELKKVEELMEQKGITDYDDGVILYSAANPQPGPLDDEPSPSGTTWEFPEFARFSADPVKASRELAHEVIRDLRRKTGRR